MKTKIRRNELVPSPPLQNQRRLPEALLRLCGGFEELGPVGEMVERG